MKATLVPGTRSKLGLPMFRMLAAVLLLSGCPATSDEVRPPRDQFYFPTGMDISPDQEFLFVANANSDLRYDSGTALAVSLDRVDNLVEEWLSSGRVPEGREDDCAVDLMVP